MLCISHSSCAELAYPILLLGGGSYKDLADMILIRSKRILFSAMGAAGGAVGALGAQLVHAESGTILTNLFQTGAWSGISAAFIACALAWAGELYHRKEGFPAAVMWPALRAGAIAGVIAGLAGQAMFTFPIFGDSLARVAFQVACWGLMGLLIGLRFSRFIPNMSRSRASVGGGVGGILGGGLFLAVSIFVPELVGRLLGISILGAALGFSLVLAESLFRKAALEVVWAPNEKTVVTLGKDCVYLGGGDDHVFIAGLPQHAISIVVENGRILCRQQGEPLGVVLKNGSQIKVGRMLAVIRAST